MFAARNMTFARPAAGGGYDLDANDWFTRVESHGGSFSLGGSFTESVTKGIWNDFILGLKSDGVWPLIDEMAVFFGVSNLAGARTKIKTFSGESDELTNTGYVDADVTPTGSTSGLQGNSSKFLDTGISPLSLSASDFSWGVLFQSIDTSTSGALDGGIGSSYAPTNDTNRFFISWNGYLSNIGIAIGNIDFSVTGTGLFYSLNAATPNVTAYEDGAVKTSSTSWNGAGFQSGNIQIGRIGSFTANKQKIRFYFVGRQLNHTNLYDRINAAVAAFT